MTHGERKSVMRDNKLNIQLDVTMITHKKYGGPWHIVEYLNMIIRLWCNEDTNLSWMGNMKGFNKCFDFINLPEILKNDG